jgi:hypothetical protein
VVQIILMSNQLHIVSHVPRARRYAFQCPLSLYDFMWDNERLLDSFREPLDGADTFRGTILGVSNA